MKTYSILPIFLWVLMLPFSIVAQWHPQNITGLPNSANSQLIFSPVDANIVWGIQSTDQGIVIPKFILTTNGGSTWTVSNVQIPSTHTVRSIHALDVNTAYVAVDDPSGSNSGIYKTTNSGSSWAKHDSAFLGTGRHPVQIYFFDNNNGLCVGNPSTFGYWEIYTTSNGGGNWTRVPQSNIPNVGDDVTFTTTSAGSGNSYWFGTCGRDLFRTTDKGLTWDVKQNAFAEPPAGFCGVDIAFKDPLNGIAVTYTGDLINRVYKTSDGGITWSIPTIFQGLPSFFFLNHVAEDIYLTTARAPVSPTTPGSAFTSDGGNTWHLIDSLIHGPASSSDGWSWSGGINDIVYKISDSFLPVELTSFTALAQDSKVILNWVTASEINNLGFEIQREFAENDFATVGFVKGEGTTTNKKEYSYTDKNLSDGKYKYRLKQVDFNGNFEYSKIVEVDVRSLDNFTLEQNYPNPFNPTTTIGYVLKEKGNVKLSLMNITGEEIAVLVYEEQDKGYHKVELNGKNLSSGVYFYQLKAGNLVQVKKMLLMK